MTAVAHGQQPSRVATRKCSKICRCWRGLLPQAGPVQKAPPIHGGLELVLVPHGILHTVPFSMLPFQGKPLVSRYTLRYLPFASLPPLRSRPFHAPTATILFSPGTAWTVPASRALSRDRKGRPQPSERTAARAGCGDGCLAGGSAGRLQRAPVHVIAHPPPARAFRVSMD